MTEHTTPSGASPEILIVEDSPIQAKLLERTLLRAGYRVSVAKDGSGGLEAACREKPALVISDINMPVMNGFDMCRAIKANGETRHIPVILLTMLDDPADVIRGLNAGADGYIHKPYDEKRMLPLLRLVLAHPAPPPPAAERRKMVAELDGQQCQITASSGQQILNMLLYTYESMVLKNRDLAAAQGALKALNEHLEKTVAERTRALSAEISEHERVERALLDSEEKFRQISATAQDAVMMMDNAGRVVFWNGAAEKIFGHMAGEALGKALHTLIVPERFGRAFTEKFPAFAATGAGPIIGKTLELAALRKNGTEFPVELSVSAVKLGDRWHAVGFVRDITARRRDEQALLKLNRAFRTLSKGNRALVRAGDEAGLLRDMCRAIVETGGYSAAWVGYAQHDAERNVRPMAECGFDAGYADTMRVTWADDERGQGPTGKAVRSGETQIVRDVAADPGCAPWRDQALKRGYTSAIALPLSGDAGVFGNLTIYAAEAFDEDETALLQEMAGDLAFGIHMLRLRDEQRRGAEQIRRGLEGTVGAVASMVELRDPYTAGHQRRVAKLAAAIAVELGLPEERVRGIHLAGTIHDLGKIRTPAEILSKPGKLSATEFGLIRDHPGNGHEILKDIEFPWPIAQMVLQHHEKLDGSGYPQGLKGEEILPEARILTVADVVEAMSSHRPYRPGLGIEAALAEIAGGRGARYDPDAADACARLFREKGFKFE